MTPILTIALEPIRLVDAHGAPAADATPWLTWALFALAGLALVAAIATAAAFLLPRIRPDHDPADRAFRALSRRLRIPRTHRAALRSLAQRAGAPPVALLLSHALFSRAVGLADHDADPTLRARRLDLEHRLFG